MASGTDPISLLVDESKRESYDEPPPIKWSAPIVRKRA